MNGYGFNEKLDFTIHEISILLARVISNYVNALKNCVKAFRIHVVSFKKTAISILILLYAHSPLIAVLFPHIGLSGWLLLDNVFSFMDPR